MTRSLLLVLFVAALVTIDIVHDFMHGGSGSFLRGYLLGGAVVSIIWLVASMRSKPSTHIQLVVQGDGNTVVSTEIERMKTNA